MHETHLVGVHEAGVAHHVAPIGEVHGQHRAPPVTDGAGAVIVQLAVVVRRDVPPGEILLNPGEELRINGHDVFEAAMERTVLDHPHLPVPLDNLGLDLPHLLGEQGAVILFPLDDPLPGLLHALGAQGIRGAGPAQVGLGFLPGLQDRFVRPLRGEGRAGAVLIEELNGIESESGGE